MASCLWVGVAIGLCGCADIATTGVGITYSDGYAAPGESVQLIVNTRRSLAGHVVRVTAESSPWHASESVLFEEDPGRSYGSYLSTPTRLSGTQILRNLFVGDPQHPQDTVTISIPREASERGSVPLRLHMTYIRAISAGSGSFDTELRDEVLTAPVTVSSPGYEWLLCLRDSLGRFALAVLLMALFSRILKLSDAGRVPHWLTSIVAIFWAYGQWRFASEPISAIWGLVQTGYRALVWIAVTAAASFLVNRIERRFARRNPPASHSTPSPRPSFLAEDQARG